MLLVLFFIELIMIKEVYLRTTLEVDLLRNGWSISLLQTGDYIMSALAELRGGHPGPWPALATCNLYVVILSTWSVADPGLTPQGGLIKENVDLQLRFNSDLILCYSNCYSVLVEISPFRGGLQPPPGSANARDHWLVVKVSNPYFLHCHTSLCRQRCS
jgi:hypothetical protein